MKPYKVLALLKKVSLLKAGDRRVKVNGEPLKVDYRIVADDLFRDGLQSLEEALTELESVKSELEMPKYTRQSAVSELSRYKQKTDEIVKGLKADIEKVKLDLHVEKEAHKVDADLLKQAQAERDELKAALKPFQDYPDDFSKEAPKDKFTMTVFCSDIAKAQQLLKAKP